MNEHKIHVLVDSIPEVEDAFSQCGSDHEAVKGWVVPPLHHSLFAITPSINLSIAERTGPTGVQIVAVLIWCRLRYL
ncbi:hypothetical protein HN873_051454 [Arachis hypogaea]